ncbi:MAG: ISNCY family transposase [Proteobacteria bacterium]|nr:ISNCY family transposase [Pseudomonadota bacterium]
MGTRTITMSRTELDRFGVITRVLERRLTQPEAARMLGLGVRQVQRLCAAVRRDGADGLVSRQRGRPSPKRFPESYTRAIVTLICEHYSDFGPTLATEKLAERHGIHVSNETVRKLMIAGGLWKTRAQRRPRIQQPRPRRPCFGELIQIDGSEHRWFENRAPACVLLVFVDDATGQLVGMRFCESESTFEYMQLAKSYLLEYGKPVAFYSDKHSVFRVNKVGATRGEGMTQFGRALHDLNIESICANSAPAKGRVERANGTLQDRLVKELRLAGVSSIEAGNAFLEPFLCDYNARFGRAPMSDHDAHRKLLKAERIRLDDVFCWQESRAVSRSLTLQYDKVIYLITPGPDTNMVAGKHVTVCDYPDGRLKIRYEGRELPYKEFDRLSQVHQADVVNNKRLGSVLAFVREQQLAHPERRSRHGPARRYPTTITTN